MNKKICIVNSNFYPKISKLLINSSIKTLKHNNYNNCKVFDVPGAFEIPIVISSLIKKYDGFIALGCVIRGETSHYNHLCDSIFNSIMQLNIKYKKPIGNGILTCNNFNQALYRANKKKSDKGSDAAKALISVFKIIK
jgi:6,7-dimethyl-8-ribityllumazine synthase